METHLEELRMTLYGWKSSKDAETERQYNKLFFNRTIIRKRQSRFWVYAIITVKGGVTSHNDMPQV